MHPILFSFNSFNLYSYGMMVALGIILAVFLIEKQAEVYSLDKEKILDLIFWTVIYGLIGGRVFYIFLYPEIYFKNPLDILKLWEGGLVFYGGLIFGIFAAFVNIKTKKLPVLKTIDILVLHVPLAHAFGRIGCFFNGCCLGKQTDFFLGVTFPGHLFPVHPTQLYSAFLLIGLFFILKAIQKNQKFPGQILAGYLIFYSMIRFGIEFLRINPKAAFGLSLYQFISIGLFISGITAYKVLGHKNNEK